MQTSIPAPNEDPDELARFAELAAHWWDEDGPMKPLHVMNAPRLAFVERHARLAGAALLDVGTGGGLLAEAAARRGAQVIGIDQCAPLIDTARLHARAAGVDVTYECVGVTDFAARHADKFDVVTAMELIEHVPDPARLVRECLELVKPGGCLIVSTINRTVRAYLGAVVGAEYVLRLLPRGTHDYQRFLRPSELDRMARDAGARTVDLSGIRYLPVLDTATLCRDLGINYIAALRR